MNKYAIYCSEEQTRKALELGAPIYTWEGAKNAELEGTFSVGNIVYFQPTAEEMIGWLEEQGLFVEPYINGESEYSFAPIISTIDDGEIIRLDSEENRKEATLSAIDAALDYLTKNKK